MTDENTPRTSNQSGVLRELAERLRADGGRYLLSVGMTAEERAHTPAPTFGGKATRRWLSDDEYAALCALLTPDETTPVHRFGNGHRATLDKAIEWAQKYGGDGDLSDLKELREWLGTSLAARFIVSSMATTIYGSER